MKNVPSENITIIYFITKKFYRYQIMTEYRKSVCVYHPDKTITNFCRDKNCLMPLCPSCISQHSEYHAEILTVPAYNTIGNALEQVQTNLRELIYSFEQDRKRNKGLIRQITNLSNVIKEKVLVAKNLVYDTLQAAFQRLQKDTELALKKIQQQQNVYSLRKCQEYETLLHHKVDQIYHMISGLKSDRNLSHLIHFHKQKHVELTTMHSQISHFLYNNQNYEHLLEVNSDSIHSISSLISRMIKTQHKGKKVPVSRLLQTEQLGNADQTSQIKKSPFKNSNRLEHTPRGSIQKISKVNKSGIRTTVTAHNNVPFDNSPYKNTNLKKPIVYENIVDSDVQEVKQYRNEFENLSQKVRDMRRQNELLSKNLRYR